MNIGDKVHILSTGETGVIEKSVRLSYPNTCYIVALNDGTRIKCIETDLRVIDEIAPVSNMITISRDDFERAVSKVLTPSIYTDEIDDYAKITVLCLSGEIVCKKLVRELFGGND